MICETPIRIDHRSESYSHLLRSRPVQNNGLQPFILINMGNEDFRSEKSRKLL
jgi:hypothetical protein